MFGSEDSFTAYEVTLGDILEGVVCEIEENKLLIFLIFLENVRAFVTRAPLIFLTRKCYLLSNPLLALFAHNLIINMK